MKLIGICQEEIASTKSNFLLDRVIGFVDEAGAANVMCLHFGKVYDTGLM